MSDAPALNILFRAWNALTGTKERPATHNMPALVRLVYLALANRADKSTDLAKPGIDRLVEDTGLGAKTVRGAVADLLEHEWLVDSGTEGPPNRYVRVFLVRDEGEPWESSTSRARALPDSWKSRFRPGLASETGLAHDAGPASDGRPGSHHEPTRARAGCEPGLAPDADIPIQLPIHLPIQKPIGSDHARGASRSGQQKIPLVDIADPPALQTDSPPEKPTRAKKDPPPPEDPGTLDPRARAAYDAIAADESLRPICLGAVQLARDLCKIAPLVDVAFEVAKAGVWLRGDPGDPRRRKTRGNAYLTNWISRAQERAEQAPRPAPPPPKEPKPEPYRAPRPDPPPGAKPVDWNEWQERMRRETDAWNARRAQGVSRG